MRKHEQKVRELLDAGQLAADAKPLAAAILDIYGLLSDQKEKDGNDVRSGMDRRSEPPKPKSKS